MLSSMITFLGSASNSNTHIKGSYGMYGMTAKTPSKDDQVSAATKMLNGELKKKSYIGVYIVFIIATLTETPSYQSKEELIDMESKIISQIGFDTLSRNDASYAIASFKRINNTLAYDFSYLKSLLSLVN